MSPWIAHMAQRAWRIMAGLYTWWCRGWYEGAMYRGILWYRDRWREQPMRHTGAILLAAVVTHLVGHLGDQGVGQHWVASAVLGGVGFGGVFWREDWASIQRSSRVVRWWTRRREAQSTDGRS